MTKQASQWDSWGAESHVRSEVLVQSCFEKICRNNCPSPPMVSMQRQACQPPGVPGTQDTYPPVGSAQFPPQEQDVRRCSEVTQPPRSYLLSLQSCFYIFQSICSWVLTVLQSSLNVPSSIFVQIEPCLLLLWEPSRLEAQHGKATLGRNLSNVGHTHPQGDSPLSAVG